MTVALLLIDIYHCLIWLTVSDGFCYTAEMEPALFGYNSTSGCLLPVSKQSLTQCNVLRSVVQRDVMFDLNPYIVVLKLLYWNVIFLFRDTVKALQAALITATYVAKNGNPDPLTMTDWVNISCKLMQRNNWCQLFHVYLSNEVTNLFIIILLLQYWKHTVQSSTRYLFFFFWFYATHNISIPVVTLNSSTATEDTPTSCYGIPSHQHIQVWSLITGIVDGVPQRDIRALQVRCVWGV